MGLYSESDFEIRLFEGLPNTIPHRSKLVRYKYLPIFRKEKGLPDCS